MPILLLLGKNQVTKKFFFQHKRLTFAVCSKHFYQHL